MKGFHSHATADYKPAVRHERSGSSLRDKALDQKSLTGDKSKSQQSTYNFVGIAG